MSLKPHSLYYDHSRPAAEQPGFPTGQVRAVFIDSQGEWVHAEAVWIGPNTHCALRHHGVVDELDALDAIQGRVGMGLDALLPPSAVEEAAAIFYEADRKTYGATYDFLAFQQDLPELIQYRIAIHNREYQQTLSRLQFLSTTASRLGHGLRLRL